MRRVYEDMEVHAAGAIREVRSGQRVCAVSPSLAQNANADEEKLARVLRMHGQLALKIDVALQLLRPAAGCGPNSSPAKTSDQNREARLNISKLSFEIVILPKVRCIWFSPCLLEYGQQIHYLGGSLPSTLAARYCHSSRLRYSSTRQLHYSAPPTPDSHQSFQAYERTRVNITRP